MINENSPTGSTGSPAAGLLERAEKHLTDWLKTADCDCENGHYCGRTEVQKTRDDIRAALSAPSPAPAPWADPAFTPMQASANMTLGWTDAQWQEFFALIPEDKYRAVWGAKVRGAAPSTVPALPLLRRRSP